MIIDMAHFVQPIVKLNSIDQNPIMANYSDEILKCVCL